MTDCIIIIVKKIIIIISFFYCGRFFYCKVSLLLMFFSAITCWRRMRSYWSSGGLSIMPREWMSTSGNTCVSRRWKVGVCSVGLAGQMPRGRFGLALFWGLFDLWSGLVVFNLMFWSSIWHFDFEYGFLVLDLFISNQLFVWRHLEIDLRHLPNGACSQFHHLLHGRIVEYIVEWRRIGRVNAFQPEGRGFESCSTCHVGTLGKSFTYSRM